MIDFTPMYNLISLLKGHNL